MPSLCLYEMRFLVFFQGHWIEGYMLEDVCIYFWGACLVSLMPRFIFHRGLNIDEEWTEDKGSTYII